jgi:hypothetical protein
VHGPFRPIASWHRAGPCQADAQGAPRHDDRAPVTRGGAAAGGSPLASPRRRLCHVDEGAEGVAPGMMVGAAAHRSGIAAVRRRRNFGVAAFGQQRGAPVADNMLGGVLQLEGVEERVRAGSIWPDKDLGQRSLKLGGRWRGGSKSGVPGGRLRRRSR